MRPAYPRTMPPRAAAIGLTIVAPPLAAPGVAALDDTAAVQRRDDTFEAPHPSVRASGVVAARRLLRTRQPR